MNTKMKKLLCYHRMHHPRAYLEHLYIKREICGKGLMKQEFTDNTTTKGLKKCIDT